MSSKKPRIQSLRPAVTMVEHRGPRSTGTSFGDAARLTADQRGYGTAWKKKRLAILKRDRYVCQCTRCKEQDVVRAAGEVDHIIPKFEGGTDADDNLQSINTDCHKLKTAEESKRAKALGIELPTWNV